MSALKQSEFTFFTTGQQSKTLAKSDWYSSRKMEFASEKDLINISGFQFHKDHPVFIATSEKSFLKFLQYFIDNILSSASFARFHKTSPVFIDLTSTITEKYFDVLKEIFPVMIPSVSDDFFTLGKNELMTVISKDINTRKLRAIGVNLYKELGIFKIIRGDFSSLIVKMDSLLPSGAGVAPHFDDVEIIDFGNAIRFGEYEASMRGLLYENDKNYRLEKKKQRLSSEKSFGACLRRYRIQKKIKQSDLKNTSEKTIRRIEEGDKPTETTKTKILNELNIAEDDLMSF